MSRLQIDINSEKLREIENLMKQLDIPTKREFFHLALTLLKWAIKETESGNTIAAINEEGIYKELVIPGMTPQTKF